MEPIEITAHFDEHGTITPLHFTWKGGNYRVESTGRRWQDEDGQHWLVMAANGHIYQLTYKSGEQRWYISTAGPEHKVV